MGKWQWARQRQCFGWVILLGLVSIVGILHTEIIPSTRPLLPLRTIQAHLYNYVHGESVNTNRIAICLVGGARKFELTGPSLIEYVVNRYNNSDIFLHAPFDKDSYKFGLLNQASSPLAAVRIFSQQSISETSQQAQVLTSSGSPNGLQGLLQYFNLVEGCLTMIKSYQIKHNIRYDWIVRTRVDGYWNGPLPPPESYSKNKYIVPPGSQFGGLNDRLGIGDMETSEVALSRMSLTPILYDNNYRNLNSETAFKHQLDVKGVGYMFKTFPFCILSERKYEWPPSRWGVPVASLSSKGDLNGAKCRPCTPASRGIDAMNIIGTLIKSWSWLLSTPGLELCDAHESWEENWEQIFDKVAGPKFSVLRKKVKNRNLADCIKDFEAMKQNTVEWDAPPSETICKKAFQQSG